MELIQNKEGLVATLTVKIPQEDYAAKVEKELKKIRQTTQVRGFRPGNAPMPLIKKMYEQPILADEINKILFEAIKNYEKENSEYLIGQVIPSENNLPYTDFNSTKDFEFVYEAGFFPEFNYQINENIELPYYNITFSDLEIDAKIEELRNHYFILEQLESVEKDSAKSIIHAEVKYIADGEEKTINPVFPISYISDEYKPLFWGAKKGDLINIERHVIAENAVDLLDITEKEFELLPEIIPFTITNIAKQMPAKLDQSFFDCLLGKDKIQNEEELREYVRDILITDYENISLNKLYLDSIKILKEKINVVLPEDFITKYVRCIQKEDEEYMSERFKRTVQYFTENAKWTYIINSVLRVANATITVKMLKDDIQRFIERQVSNYHVFDMNDLIEHYLNDEKELHESINRVKCNQFARILKEKAKLNIINLSFDEFFNFFTVEKDTEHNPEMEELVKNGIVVEESVTETPEIENSSEYNPETNGIAVEESITETPEIENQENNKE
jgi:trigger factor